MKIRTVKPSFWQSPEVRQLPLMGRLLFIGLMQYVDDNGMGLDSPALIAAELFPDEMEADPAGTIAEVDSLLWIMHGLGLVTRVIQQCSSNDAAVLKQCSGSASAGRKCLIGLPSFARHQRITQPRKGHAYPSLGSESLQVREVIEQCFSSASAVLQQCSSSDAEMKLPEREGEGERNIVLSNVTFQGEQNSTPAEAIESPAAHPTPAPVDNLPSVPPVDNHPSMEPAYPVPEKDRTGWAPQDTQLARARTRGVNPHRLAEQVRTQHADEIATTTPGTPEAHALHARLWNAFEQALTAEAHRKATGAGTRGLSQDNRNRLEALKKGQVQ